MSVALPLSAEDYTVGWLCALPKSELVAAIKMLDTKHPTLQLGDNDSNTYTYGSINRHNVVIACMPPGMPGPVSAQKLVQPLNKSFPNMRIHLFVGIGGGVPRNSVPQDPNKDVHLGDVVVGWAEETGAPSVVPWDFVRYYGEEKIESLGSLDKPDRRLLSALSVMLSDRELGEYAFHEHLTRLATLDNFAYPGLEKDKLYSPDFEHVDTDPNSTCDHCDPTRLAQREPRKKKEPVFHQGTIASGSSVIKNARKRDEISKKFNGALCIEMEAAGVMDDTRCLVIRGIADYADSHKNGRWQNYAAATAAAFARQFLFTIQPQVVKEIVKSSEFFP